jgi:steroid 5-alpha reductase family enzyme
MAEQLPFATLFLNNGHVILCLMTLLWFLSLALKNASIVDIFWGVGFVLVTWLAFSYGPCKASPATRNT